MKTGPLSRTDQIHLNKQLHRLFDNHASDNGIAAVSGMNGRPIHVAKIPIPLIGSSKASPSTRKSRARFIETMRDVVSSQNTMTSSSSASHQPHHINLTTIQMYMSNWCTKSNVINKVINSVLLKLG